MINVDEKLTKNVKIKKVVEEKASKEKKKFNIIIFDDVDVKNLNAEVFMKYYINDTTTISNNFTKSFFKFENFLKKENATQAHEKKQN